jgi:hypothetical protein
VTNIQASDEPPGFLQLVPQIRVSAIATKQRRIGLIDSQLWRHRAVDFYNPVTVLFTDINIRDNIFRG